jgi:hypothetical protein
MHSASDPNDHDDFGDPDWQCMDCGTIGPHACLGVPGGFGDDDSDRDDGQGETE